MKLLKHFLSQKRDEREAELYRNLIRHEAQIGGQLFGPVPANHRREFFCLDEHTWIWHEEWVDKQGVSQTKTTRYTIRPGVGIMKVQDGQEYQPLGLEESRNLRHAAEEYVRRVRSELYNFA